MRVVAVLLLALLLLGAAPSPPVVGALYNLTGAQALLDGPSARGARLAARQAGIRLELRDGRSEPEVLPREVKDLLALSPSALVGLSDTDMLLAAAPAAAGAVVPFVTSGATSPRLPAQVPDLFLACFGDNVQAAAGAEFAAERLGAKRVAVLWYDGMEYTRLLAGYFRTRFAEMGGTVAYASAYGAGDFAARAAALPEVDLVYLAAGPEEAPERARALLARGFPVMGGDSYDSPAFQGPFPGPVYFTTHALLAPDSPDPRVRRFLQDYAGAYDGERADGFAALGYDAVMLVADALRRAPSAEPAAVRAALAETRDFAGVTGRIRYEPGQRIPRKSVAVVETGPDGASLAETWLPRGVPAP